MDFIKILAIVGGFFGIVGSAISLRFWFIMLLFLAVLNILGVINIPLFAGISALSVIGTPLFMLGGGIIMMVISFVIVAIAAA